MQAILSDCQRVELLANRIYERLAANETYAGEIRTTFRHLAAEELEHARQIELAMRLPEEGLGAVSRIAWVKVDEARQLAEMMLQEVTSTPVTEEAALRLAVRIENEFLKVHLDNALHFFEQRVVALFEGLAGADQGHLDTLNDCIDWWKREGRRLS